MRTSWGEDGRYVEQGTGWIAALHKAEKLQQSLVTEKYVISVTNGSEGISCTCSGRVRSLTLFVHFKRERKGEADFKLAISVSKGRVVAMGA